MALQRRRTACGGPTAVRRPAARLPPRRRRCTLRAAGLHPQRMSRRLATQRRSHTGHRPVADAARRLAARAAGFPRMVRAERASWGSHDPDRRSSDVRAERRPRTPGPLRGCEVTAMHNVAASLGSCLLSALLVAQEGPEPSPVPQLRDLLHSADPSIRIAAAERLGSVSLGVAGLPAQAAVPELLAALESDEDRRVADMAALALASIGRWPLGALDHIGAQLAAWERQGAPADAVEHVREALQQAERSWPGSAIVPHLLTIAREPRCTAGVLGVLA